jgi:GNAT superfamily N-acetyltransferase
MPGPLTTLADRVKRKGAAHVAKRALFRLFSPFYMNLRFYEISHNITGELPEVVIPDGCETRELGKHDLHLLRGLVGRRWLRVYGRRMDRGMRCFALLKDGEVTNFFWCAFSDAVDDILGLRIHVGDGEVYSFNTLTSPKHRHRGLFFSLIAFNLRVLRAMGIRRVLAVHIKSDMVKVYPHYRKAGIPTEILQTIDYRKILLWKRETWIPYDGHLSSEIGLERSVSQ